MNKKNKILLNTLNHKANRQFTATGKDLFGAKYDPEETYPYLTFSQHGGGPGGVMLETFYSLMNQTETGRELDSAALLKVLEQMRDFREKYTKEYHYNLDMINLVIDTITNAHRDEQMRDFREAWSKRKGTTRKELIDD